jgi:DNA-binding transcriptional MerR regulator
MENRYLLASEAGRIAGCSAENIRVLERTGKLKAAIKTAGGVRLFSEGDIRELAVRRKQKDSKRN